jgi:uncharacterized membrane protein
MSTTKSNDDPSERSTGRHPEVARWESVVVSRGEAVVPAWLRPHRGEQRWSVLGVVTVAIALQVLLPDEFVLRPRTAAPVLEALLCVILLVRNPGPLDEYRPALRRLSLVVIGILAATNVVSTILLVHVVVSGVHVSAVKILASGAAIWLTNVIVYALWYWEFDRGGPVARAKAVRATPDFLFPQMSDARLDPDWHATFLDYLYVSFTNATAFSPTDTMPLTRWAKMLMLAQSLVSLVTVGLVAARAVNVLPSS